MRRDGASLCAGGDGSGWGGAGKGGATVGGGGGGGGGGVGGGDGAVSLAACEAARVATTAPSQTCGCETRLLAVALLAHVPQLTHVPRSARRLTCCHTCSPIPYPAPVLLFEPSSLPAALSEVAQSHRPRKLRALSRHRLVVSSGCLALNFAPHSNFSEGVEDKCTFVPAIGKAR
eukprot:3080520-Pleurochrysis_carterae.AAC.1